MSTPSLVGTFDRSLDSTRFLTADELQYLDYRYLGGILETVPGIFIRDHHSVGSYNQLNIRGVDWRGVSVMENGRLLNEPASGIYNLFHFTTEYADRIEIITGPRAFLFGLNSTGGAVNLLTKNYNSNRAFSKINYTEAPYSYQYSDGTFSQNISRKVNFTFGFQHQGTDGRFANSADNAWNMRVKVRYNLSKNFNIILSEYLTSTETQFNGGIDITQTGFTLLAFDPLQATMKSYETFEKVTRHDLDLSLVGTVLGDTTNVSLLTFYYSGSLREYRDADQHTDRFGIPHSNNVFINSDHRSSWMGAVFTQDYHTEWQRFNLGANIELRQIEGSPNLGRRRHSLGSVWVKEELVLDRVFSVAGFGRYDNYLRESGTGIGADATASLLSGLSVYGGISTSKRFPNYQELFWTDSTVSRREPITSERHHTAELGIRVKLDELDFRIAYFHRTIENPILLLPGGSGYVFPGVEFTNGDKIVTNGIEAALQWRIWLLYFEGTGMFITEKEGSGAALERYPKFSANGGVYFWQKLLNGNLDLKIGFKGKVVTGSQGEVFNPEILAYVPNTGLRITTGGSVDGFLIAGLGRAYVHLMWENLTNTRYFQTPYYPVLDRAIKFGIAWQFLD